jgi:mycothiol synthase
MSTSTITIRPFDTEKDYTAYVAFSNAAWPEYARTEDEDRHWDNTRPVHTKWGRFMAEQANGKLVGVAAYRQPTDMYHPQRFSVSIEVAADSQRQGIGTRLYQTILDSIAPYDPIELNANTREDKISGMQFAQKFGFVEVMREWESRLKMADFDASLLQGALDKVIASGIEIYTYQDLAHDPDRDQKLYDLDCAAARDIPSIHAFNEPGFENYKERFLQNPTFLPDAWFIAVDNTEGKNKYVGVSVLEKVFIGDYINTGLTGVLAEYRGRGIASALKQRATLYARECNIPEIRTWNAQVNREMLAINEKIGYIKQPAWVEFKKVL